MCSEMSLFVVHNAMVVQPEERRELSKVGFFFYHSFCAREYKYETAFMFGEGRGVLVCENSKQREIILEVISAKTNESIRDIQRNYLMKKSSHLKDMKKSGLGKNIIFCTLYRVKTITY